jgi:putative phosphoribosyl transferase
MKVVELQHLLFGDALFRDRVDAGRRLGEALRGVLAEENAVVVGLARGGVRVAVEIARALDAPLDALVVRKIRHPARPEYALGAVTSGGGVYVRASDGLGAEELAAAVADAQLKAAGLERTLHRRYRSQSPRGRTIVLVDDGLATGATMIAAARWAKSAGAGRVVAAVPLAAVESAELVHAEVDDLVVLHELADFGAVGIWYDDFAPVEDDEVLGILEGRP